MRGGERERETEERREVWLLRTKNPVPLGREKKNQKRERRKLVEGNYMGHIRK